MRFLKFKNDQLENNDFSPRALLPRRVVDIIEIHVFCIDNSVRCCRTTAACCGGNLPHTATPRRVACSI